MRNRVSFTKIESIYSERDIELFYEDIARDWEYRARKLQARRWRKLKQQLI